MFLNNGTIQPTETCSAQTEALKQLLDNAQAVVVGAGAGLSASAGLTYSGPRFQAHFGDFIAKYHFHDMYTAGFFPYGAPETYWAYWSRHIYWNRYEREVGAPYTLVRRLVQDRDYFVITTNVDHCFQQAGFDKKRLFYTQGDYGLWQCARPCHQTTYDNEQAVRRMVAEQKDLRIPASLVPRCPVCGGPMRMNLRCDASFVQDEGWQQARSRYEDFLHRHAEKRLLFLELGVGGNTPSIIKYPFWRMVRDNPNAFYACINLEDACAPSEIAGRSLCIEDDIGGVLKSLFDSKRSE